MKRLRPLWIILANLLVLGLLLEISLRLAVPLLPEGAAAAVRRVTTGQPYAEDWTPAWVRNPDHYYILQPGLQDVLQYGSPDVSFRLTTIELWEGGGIGFRTRPVDYFVDVVVVGDSFGFCFTELADCWVTRLEEQTGLGIVNLSQPVTGSVSHARILQSFGAPLRPPLVIWQFFGNDFNDDYGLHAAAGLTPAAAAEAPQEPQGPADWLRQNSAAYAALEAVFTGQPGGRDPLFTPRFRVSYRDGELAFGNLYEFDALDMARPENQIGLVYTRDALLDTQQLLEEWGGRLVLLIIPTREEVYEHLTAAHLGPELDKLRSARLAMLELCDELELACMDALDYLRPHALAGEHLYYTDDMHLNPHGNAVLAGHLAAWLGEQGLLPAP